MEEHRFTTSDNREGTAGYSTLHDKKPHVFKNYSDVQIRKNQISKECTMIRRCKKCLQNFGLKSRQGDIKMDITEIV
jgi:hypothetical protein